MVSKEELKQKVNAAIDRKAEEIIRVSKTILENPEPGFREEKTAKLVGQVFSASGIQHRGGIALTGLKGELKGGSDGPTVGVIGELDSLIVTGHPHADAGTSAAHACGHHCQIGMMLGAAFGLMDPEVLPNLSGKVALSAVPADVRMETFVRGATVDAVLEANRKVDRALRAGAMAVGAQVNITTIPGYMPLQQDTQMMDMFKGNAVSLVGEQGIGFRRHSTGSTDMGDVSQIMPVIHPYVGGATGVGHGNDYVVQDYQLAVVTAAKALANTVVDLLADGGAAGGQILAQDRSFMTRDQYLKVMRGLAKEELYNPEG